MQENLDSEIYWAGDGRFCGDFPPFCILVPDLAAFLLNLKTAFFEAQLLS